MAKKKPSVKARVGKSARTRNARSTLRKRPKVISQRRVRDMQVDGDADGGEIAVAQVGQDESLNGPGFSIVGVGASAGGLEAFTQLLHALPVDTGMAVVLVQHLS